MYWSPSSQPPLLHSPWTELFARSSQLSRPQLSNTLLTTHTCASFLRPLIGWPYTANKPRPPPFHILSHSRRPPTTWSFPLKLTAGRGVSKIDAGLSAGSVINCWLSVRRREAPSIIIARQCARCARMHAELTWCPLTSNIQCRIVSFFCTSWKCSINVDVFFSYPLLRRRSAKV